MFCVMHRVMMHYDSLCGAWACLSTVILYAVSRLEQYCRAGTSETAVEAHLREMDEYVRSRSRRDETEPTSTLVHVNDCTLQARGCGSTRAAETQVAKAACTSARHSACTTIRVLLG